MPHSIENRYDGGNQSYGVNNRDEVYKRVRIDGAERTVYNELLTVNRQTYLDIKSTWGISDIRDLFFVNGTLFERGNLPANTIGEENGEITFQTGTNANEVRSLETIERGQYLTGTLIEAGCAVRFEDIQDDGSDLGPDQEVLWGYFNDENGMGFGIDGSRGLFLFYEKNDVVTRIYREEWDDPLDGEGRSGFEYSLEQGAVFKLYLNHYGYGELNWAIVPDVDGERILTYVHTLSFSGDINLPDPNQPINIVSRNGASGNIDKKIFVAGRQVTLWGGLDLSRFRTYEEPFYAVTATSATDWTPVIAIRKKSELNGRPNSVNAIFSQFLFYTDNSVEISISTRADDSGLTFRPPDRVQDDETSVEVQVASDAVNPLTSTVTGPYNGIQTLYSNSQGTKQSPQPTDRQDDIPISSYYAIILWARKLTTSDAEITGFIEWSEQR